MSHSCETFWEPWSDILFEFLEGNPPLPNPTCPVGPGDGLDMSQPTYLALLGAMRAIEDAFGMSPADVPDYTGPASPSVLPPEQEELLRVAAEQFVAGLHNDQFDPAGGGDEHDPFAPWPTGWMNTGAASPGALMILIGATPAGGRMNVLPPGGGADLYGKIRGALGS